MIVRKRVYSSGSGTSIMAALSTGDPAPQFSLPAIDGSTFNMADTKGKRVILTFFRFSSCPLCNMRIRRIIQRWDEFSEETVMVAVFDAKIELILKKHNAPFIVTADETYEQIASNGVKKSFFKFMWGAMRSPLTLLQATLRGYVPLMSISKLSTIPVDILIDEAGNVVEAHYCKDTADHIPEDAFSNDKASLYINVQTRTEQPNSVSAIIEDCMRNQLKILFVIFSLFSVSLSGCIESADVPRTDKVKHWLIYVRQM